MFNMLVQQLSRYTPIRIAETQPSYAVLVMIVCKEKIPTSLLLTRRTHYEGAYSDDYCFPGGKKEKDDRSFEETVKREIKEEIGILPEDYQLIGRLDDFKNRARHLVRPFTALADIEVIEKKIHLQRREVKQVEFFSLNQLSAIEEDKNQLFQSSRHPHYFFRIKSSDSSVWGLTASILVHFDNIVNGKNRVVDKYGDS